MTLQPGLNLVLLVGGVVVDNGVDGLVFGNGAFDLVEEANKLLMPVTLHILTNHGAIQHFQGREQGRHTVAFAIMGHRRAAPLLQRQSRLGPVKSLYLRRLINRQDHGMSRRRNVKTNDIMQFLHKLGIVGQFELPEAMGDETMGFPDRLHRRGRNTHHRGHRPQSPMGCLMGRWREG